MLKRVLCLLFPLVWAVAACSPQPAAQPLPPAPINAQPKTMEPRPTPEPSPTPEANSTPKPLFGRQEGAGYLAEGNIYVAIMAMDRQDFDGQSGVIITYEMQNLSGAVMDTMGALYVKVEQDYSPLLHPDTYEPTYYVIDKLDPGESLMFYEEYILDSEEYPVKIEIQEYGVDFSDAASSVYQTFTLD